MEFQLEGGQTWTSFDPVTTLFVDQTQWKEDMLSIFKDKAVTLFEMLSAVCLLYKNIRSDMPITQLVVFYNKRQTHSHTTTTSSRTNKDFNKEARIYWDRMWAMCMLWSDAFLDQTRVLDPITRMGMELKVRQTSSTTTAATPEFILWCPRKRSIERLDAFLAHFQPWLKSVPSCFINSTTTTGGGGGGISPSLSYTILSRSLYDVYKPYHRQSGRTKSFLDLTKQEQQELEAMRIMETGGSGDCLYYVISRALHIIQHNGSAVTTNTKTSTTTTNTGAYESPSTYQQWMMQFRADIAKTLSPNQFHAISSVLQTYDYDRNMTLTDFNKRVVAKQGVWGDNAFAKFLVTHPQLVHRQLGIILLSEIESKEQGSGSLMVETVPCALKSMQCQQTDTLTLGYIVIYKNYGHYQLVLFPRSTQSTHRDAYDCVLSSSAVYSSQMADHWISHHREGRWKPCL